MQSRQQLLERLRELKNYRFAGYLVRLGDSTHLVRLCVMDFERQGFHASVCYVDFIVTENIGYLSAVSKCGRLVIERLS